MRGKRVVSLHVILKIVLTTEVFRTNCAHMIGFKDTMCIVHVCVAMSFLRKFQAANLTRYWLWYWTRMGIQIVDR